MKTDNLSGMDIDRTGGSRTLGAADFENGFQFVARWLDKKTGKQKFGYTEFLITASGELWYKSKEGNWYFFRKANAADIATSSQCFRTIVEMQVFLGELMIAA